MEDDKNARALKAINAIRRLLTQEKSSGYKTTERMRVLEPPFIHEACKLIKILKEFGFGPWKPTKRRTKTTIITPRTSNHKHEKQAKVKVHSGSLKW